MNVNSIAGFSGGGSTRNLFPTQTVAATTETALLVSTDAGTTTCFVAVPAQSGIVGSATPLDPNANPAILKSGLGAVYGAPNGVNPPYVTSSMFDGRQFKVRMAGIGNAGANAAQSVIMNLYQGTSATLASDKKLGTTGAAFAMVAGGAFNFVIEAAFLWDATSQILSGSYSANIAFGTVSQFTGGTVVSNVVTSVTAAGLSFLGSITLGNAASSTVTLREFLIERV